MALGDHWIVSPCSTKSFSQIAKQPSRSRRALISGVIGYASSHHATRTVTTRRTTSTATDTPSRAAQRLVLRWAAPALPLSNSPAAPRRGRGGTPRLLKHQGLRSALPEGGSPPANGVSIPSQSFGRSCGSPAVGQEPEAVPTLPGRRSQNEPPVQSPGIHLPPLENQVYISHAHRQPLPQSKADPPTSPPIYPMLLRVSPWLWFRRTGRSESHDASVDRRTGKRDGSQWLTYHSTHSHPGVI